MGGASSWYTILSITGLLVAVWIAGRVSRKIGMSSIVLEVATGLVLGPSVLKLIPSSLSTCFHQKLHDCDTEKDQKWIADMGTKYCDLEAYIKEKKYIPSGSKYGFFGNYEGAWVGGKLYCWNDPMTVDLKGKRYCKTQTTTTGGRRLVNDTSYMTVEEVAEGEVITGSGWSRRLADDKKGKTDYDDYSKCLKSSCELDIAIKCATTPDIFTMIGHTGVAMMIFESGMHFDFEQAKTVGPWACAVAVLGTFLPLASGCALAVAFGYDLMPDGLSAGTSLAPTSVGIALKLLHEAKALQEYFGQAVMTAAFVDDVLSLILFSVLFSLGPDMSFLTFLPLILGCIFMVVAIIACVKIWPAFMKWLFSKVPDGPGTNSKVTMKDEVMWVLMFVTFAAYAQITHLCGTHLWGCFIAGMCFATDHHAHHVWVRQVKRITCWFMRIFFACTLAWSIPVKELFNVTALWKGTLMGIGPCILTKVLCAPFMGAPRWVIGWAMVGRAEFAYFIAIMAKALKMMEESLFAILIWALIYATIFAPLIFSKVLARYMAAKVEGVEVPTVSELKKKVSNIASGHLPDMEEEAEEMKRQKSAEKVDNMEEDLQKKDRQIKEYGNTIEELNQKIASLNVQVDTANNDLSNAKRELAEQQECSI